MQSSKMGDGWALGPQTLSTFFSLPVALCRLARPQTACECLWLYLAAHRRLCHCSGWIKRLLVYVACIRVGCVRHRWERLVSRTAGQPDRRTLEYRCS